MNDQKKKWWKGNLHAHFLWSDGNNFPELVIDWYKTNGYHFAALSEHDRLADTPLWISANLNREDYERYLDRFGTFWVAQNNLVPPRVRVKTFEEYRHLFEEENHFILFQSEEISPVLNETDGIHVVATNLRKAIVPKGGSSVSEILGKNINEIETQRNKYNQQILCHIAHPDPHWEINDYVSLSGCNFMEIYNPNFDRYAKSKIASDRKMWDRILTRRYLKGKSPIYGLAVDDMHFLFETGLGKSSPGQAWIMVRSKELSKSALLSSIEKGDFYFSTGVTLDEIQVSKKRIHIHIKADPGVSYKTKFIGSRLDSLQSISKIKKENIGVVLKEVVGTNAFYDFQNNDIYVRARIESSRVKRNPNNQETEWETAWVQPQSQMSFSP